MPKKAASKNTDKRSPSNGSKQKPSARKSEAKPAGKTVTPARKSASKPAAKTNSTAKAAKSAKSAIPAKSDKGSRSTAASSNDILSSSFLTSRRPTDDSHLKPFLRKQRARLLNLRDAILDSMMGVAKDSLRSRAEGSEASAFGMHQADAGSDAYDRDFALNLLSQEQDALYEIDEALKRIEQGTYGTCEISGKTIPQARLEAIPFARYTVECQAEIERQMRGQRIRRPVTSLFGLSEDEGGEGEEDENVLDNKE